MNALKILAYGGQVTAIGLLTVFAGLVIIIVCIYAMSAVFKLFSGAKKEKKAAAPAPAPAPVAAPAPAPAPAPVVEEEPAAEEEYVTDPQVIAVIAAAIAACDANTRLVVRSVKRVSSWNRTARNESVSRF